MPKRIAKRYRFEAECERKPLTAAHERRIKRFAVDRAPAALAEWRVAATEVEQFYAAPDAAMAALTLGQHALAEELAHKAISLAAPHKDNWNYGNALHFAHIVLGLLALTSGDTRLAIEELHKSGETPGSPQLGSFGPSMKLARELLKKGESEAVLYYFRQCRVFWKSGDTWLSIWEKKVLRGAVPTFLMHIHR